MYISVVGWFVCSMRTVAMYTAASNFTHQIAEVKRDDHKLVTSGIYSVMRHPSYCGFFGWSIATQLLLANPLCTVAYGVVVWRFYDERISFEEETLCAHFGSAYVDYKRRVWSGVPFIA